MKASSRGHVQYRGAGFTLIELLVVIVIIGMLATAVLVSLSAARGKGNDTGVKADLGTLQTQAILYFGLSNSYCAAGSTCISNPDTVIAGCTASGTVFNDSGTTIDQAVQNAIASAQKDVNGGSSNLICQMKSKAFMVAGKLSTGTYWCVDWKGTAVEKTAAPGASATDCTY